MFWGIVFSVIAGIAWCWVGIVTSQIVKRDLDFLTCSVQAALLAGLGSAIFVMRWRNVLDGLPPRTGDLVLVLAISGLMQALGFWLMQRAMRGGPHALIWTVGQLALVLPFLANVLFWCEPMGWRRFAGLALIAGGVYLLGRAKGGSTSTTQAKSHWVLPTFLAFICIGTSLALCTLPSHWPDWEDSARLRVPLLMAFTCLGYLGLRGLAPRRERRNLWGYSAASAAGTLVGCAILFVAMDRFEPVRMIALAYPIALGVCIVLFSIYGRAVLAEPLSRIGLATAVTGLILISV